MHHPFSTENCFKTQLTIENSSQNIVDALQTHTGFSKQQIKSIMQKGAVWLERKQTTRRIRRAKSALEKGDVIYFYHNPNVLAETPPTPELIADEGEYSVWFKPAGMLSQGSKWGDHCTLHRWAETHLRPQRPAFIVHRLDKATRGIMLIAHQKKAAHQLSQCFEKRQIHKQYYALIESTKSWQNFTATTPIDGKAATTHFKQLNWQNHTLENKQKILLDIQPKTGRKHQIRKHLAEHGHPIIGDKLYGSGQHEEDLHLVAYRLSFQSPFDQKHRDYTLNISILDNFYNVNC